MKGTEWVKVKPARGVPLNIWGDTERCLGAPPPQHDKGESLPQLTPDGCTVPVPLSVRDEATEGHWGSSAWREVATQGVLLPHRPASPGGSRDERSNVAGVEETHAVRVL